MSIVDECQRDFKRPSCEFLPLLLTTIPQMRMRFLKLLRTAASDVTLRLFGFTR